MTNLSNTDGGILDRVGRTPKKGLIAVITIAVIWLADKAIDSISNAND